MGPWGVQDEATVLCHLCPLWACTGALGRVSAPWKNSAGTSQSIGWGTNAQGLPPGGGGIHSREASRGVSIRASPPPIP